MNQRRQFLLMICTLIWGNWPLLAACKNGTTIASGDEKMKSENLLSQRETIRGAPIDHVQSTYFETATFGLG